MYHVAGEQLKEALPSRSSERSSPRKRRECCKWQAALQMLSSQVSSYLKLSSIQKIVEVFKILKLSRYYVETLQASGLSPIPN